MDANWVFTMPHLSVGRQVKLKETWPKPFLVGGFNPSERNWIVSPGKMKKISETAAWQLDKSSDQRASHWRIRCPDSCPSLTVSNHLSYLAIVSISYLDFVFRYYIHVGWIQSLFSVDLSTCMRKKVKLHRCGKSCTWNQLSCTNLSFWCTRQELSCTIRKFGKSWISVVLSFPWRKFMFSGCQRKFGNSWISVVLSFPWRKFMFSTSLRKFGNSWISVALSFPWRKFIFQHVNGNSEIHEFL